MTITSARELQRWMDDGGAMLAERRVRTVFGRGVDTGAGASSWISFASAVGSGRLVRDDDGGCHLVAHRFQDGQVLIDRTSAVTGVDELEAIVDALSPASAHPVGAGDARGST